MINVFAQGPHRLVAIGLCYAVLTAVEIIYFYNSMALVRVVGLSLQAGFASALIYAGIARARRPRAPSGFATSH